MTISVFRLYLLRAGYLLIALGMGGLTWPEILDPAVDWNFNQGVVRCMLGALTVLCLLGVRYPLQMLPLLMFELTWKMIWLARVALPAWTSGHIDDGMAENIFAVGLGAIYWFIIPWRYVIDRYVTQSGDRWAWR
ncbi:hypothetical protein [Nitrospirillum sp. BR 11828]|uniref:hypothetical protein n=1 Tax=Nitrospirillum sp. BR 11828 TaxID=3104325 RepID=UPI002ACAAFF5|nr:hypothetical protein [Nitrospirillum sp. BR 11828]MDZ5648374.1 hypothetical protein [Nitrospirillum sp. BR 11828]